MKKVFSIFLVIMMLVSIIPTNAFAADDYWHTDENGVTNPTYAFAFDNYWSTSHTDENGTIYTYARWGNWACGGFSYSVTEQIPEFNFGNSYSTGSGGYVSSGNPGSLGFSNTSPSTAAEMVISICKQYNNQTNFTGPRYQIHWMTSLLTAANSAYLSSLSNGDALLISLLNHEKILTGTVKMPTSLGDMNKVIAGKIYEKAEGYTDIEAIAQATGLSTEKVSNILKCIAEGTITEETINRGKTNTGRTNRGPYLKARALEHEKVYEYIVSEVDRMTQDEAALAILYEDFGGGYIKELMSGHTLDSYRILLYKEHLAKALDENELFNVSDYTIASTDEFKVTKKVRSVLSGIIKHELSAAEDALPEELQKFWKKSLENGILSEEEAREYLILTGEYEAGEHGIGEAAKTLVNGYKQLSGFKKALDVSGKALDVLEKVKKAEELIDYWSTDYARQELMVDNMVASLTERGSDPELLVAAKDLKSEYEDKAYGTLNKAYSKLIDEGIGSVKAAFPPLTIAESCISLVGMITGASDKVDAIETCIAMQGISWDAIQAYEEAIKAVNNGDESDEAITRVINTFALAKTSLELYYEAVIDLAETEEEKSAYKRELALLEITELGTVRVPALSGSAGG